MSLMPHETLCELESAVEAGRPLSPILQWHKHPNDYFTREAQTMYFNSLRTYWQELIDLSSPGESLGPREALLSAFKRLDSDLSLEAQVGDANSFLHYWFLRVAFSGATACVAHIDGPTCTYSSPQPRISLLAPICTAWSPSRNGRRPGGAGVQEEDGSFSAHTLSNDHNAQNENEVARIQGEHPPSEKKTVVRQV
ncbi:pyruvate dehydrogenase [acetyl-transferring]-phosphatase 1, mitochondrial-like [Salvelinus sp. IW2-2015]|uniref:pyruvate dehydrogenase [acetyl-transferring]-phosphatase 1, mitochondrial-like n=1 Tax=Salvelinus sp. IW2-2015 TaxID=2691554 RepID=UPI0038D3893B